MKQKSLMPKSGQSHKPFSAVSCFPGSTGSPASPAATSLLNPEVLTLVFHPVAMLLASCPAALMLASTSVILLPVSISSALSLASCPAVLLPFCHCRQPLHQSCQHDQPPDWFRLPVLTWVSAWGFLLALHGKGSLLVYNKQFNWIFFSAYFFGRQFLWSLK